MRRLFLICLLCSFSWQSYAQQKDEASVIAKLFSALQHNDADAYANLFAGVDSLSEWVLQTAPTNSAPYRKMLSVKNSQYYKAEYDTAIKNESFNNFKGFLEKAEPLEIHWSETVLVRYELEKMRRGRGLITEKIATLRLMGYVFFKDMLMQKTYCFSVADMMNVKGNWYGGELVNVFEANTKEQYAQKYKEEQKRLHDIALGIADTTAAEHNAVDGDEHEKPSAMKEVVERRYYKGWFDDEIPVVLYVRYIKGPCKEGVCSWEALFKFGDQDEYVKMIVSRATDGKWLFNEELGGMELVLDGKEYTGSYAANSDKTEYEVSFHQMPASPKKLKSLDEILDLGLYGQ